MGTFIVGVIVFVLVGLAAFSVYKNKKSGGGCCGGCDGCRGCSESDLPGLKKQG